jgi:hypothetical protein
MSLIWYKNTMKEYIIIYVIRAVYTIFFSLIVTVICSSLPLLASGGRVLESIGNYQRVTTWFCKFNDQVTCYSMAENATNGNNVTVTLCYRQIVISNRQKNTASVLPTFFMLFSQKVRPLGKKITIF